jgi:hypothetical protein
MRNAAASCRKHRVREAAQTTKGDAITVGRIEKGVPTLVAPRDLVERFHGMVRERDPTGLPIWITDAANSHHRLGCGRLLLNERDQLTDWMAELPARRRGAGYRSPSAKVMFNHLSKVHIVLSFPAPDGRWDFLVSATATRTGYR